MAGKEAAGSALKVVVFLGTVRENNYGSRAAKFVVSKLSEKGHDVTLLGEPLQSSHALLYVAKRSMA